MPRIILLLALFFPTVGSAQITLVGTGGVVEGMGVTPPLPSGIQANDILILVTGSGSWGALPGWTQKLSSSVLTIYWKRAGTSETAPTIANQWPIVARIAAYRGVIASGDPFEAAAISLAPSITTGTDNALVLLAAGAWAESYADWGDEDQTYWIEAGAADTSISNPTSGPATNTVFLNSDAIDLPALSTSIGLWSGVKSPAGPTGSVSQPAATAWYAGGAYGFAAIDRALLALVPASGPGSAPGTPGLIAGPTTYYSPASFTMSWGASSSGITSRYDLYENDVLAYSGTALSANITGRGPGTYRYKVQACNSAGCSAFTAEHQVTVLDPAAFPSDRLYPVSAWYGADTDAPYMYKLGTLTGTVAEAGGNTFVSEPFTRTVIPWNMDVSLHVAQCSPPEDMTCSFLVSIYRRSTTGALTAICSATVDTSTAGTYTTSCATSGAVAISQNERLEVGISIIGSEFYTTYNHASFLYGVSDTWVKVRDDAALAVGVLSGGTVCADGTPASRIFMDTEDNDTNHPGTSSVSGWTGATNVDGNNNVTFYFCKVDGAKFLPLNLPPTVQQYDPFKEYAVLKLGVYCPTGSEEFGRFFDNEDSNNASSISGNVAPNYQDSYGNTMLRFCLFRYGDPVMQPDPLVGNMFPALGFTYGVFAPSGFPYALSGWAGTIYTDDEDTNTTEWFDIPPTLDAASVYRIVDGCPHSGGNTTLRTALVSYQ